MSTDAQTDTPGSPHDRRADRVLLLAIIALVIAYCIDAVNASTSVVNLILVLPLSAGIIALCAVALLRPGAGLPPANAAAADATAESSTSQRSALPGAICFGGYIVLLPWLGLDVGTSAFLAAYLWLDGERRLPVILAYAAVLGLGFAFGFSRMLPYPMPLLLLGPG